MDKESKNSNHPPNESDQSGIGRRSLVKGLASTPIIFTIASRPAWANRCTVSGHLSGNLSNPNTDGESTQCTYVVFGEDSFKMGDNGPYYMMLWGSGILGSLSHMSDVSVLGVTSSERLSIADVFALQPSEPGAKDLKIEVLSRLNAILWEELTAYFNNQSSRATSVTYMAITDMGFYYPFTKLEIGGSSQDYRADWDSFKKL